MDSTSNKNISLVISPLLSLISDQLRNLPPCLRGASLTSQQNPREVLQVTKDLFDGKIDILFLSPEKLVSPTFLELFR